jgi:hypothetical protein
MINLSGMRLPRELEADGTAGDICQVLMARTVTLLPDDVFSVPMITMGDPLKKILQRARFGVGWRQSPISWQGKRGGLTTFGKEEVLPAAKGFPGYFSFPMMAHSVFTGTLKTFCSYIPPGFSVACSK